MSLIKLGEFDGKSIYYDETMDTNRILFGRKSASIAPQGIIYVPYVNKEKTEIPIQKLTNPDDIFGEENWEPQKPKTKYYDSVFCILGGSNIFENYEKILIKLKNE